MNEEDPNKKPFIGDQNIHDSIKEKLLESNLLEEAKNTSENQLKDLEQFLEIEKQNKVWTENRISDREKESKILLTAIERERENLKSDEEFLKTTEKLSNSEKAFTEDHIKQRVQDIERWQSELHDNEVGNEEDIKSLAESEKNIEKLDEMIIDWRREISELLLQNIATQFKVEKLEEIQEAIKKSIITLKPSQHN